MTPLVSVLICTYRRPDLLADTLRSLRGLRSADGLTWEAVVIDNDPGGSARECVAAEQTGWPAGVALRYAREDRPGLGNARNRGIDEARGEILAFLDDDVFVEPDWLEQLVGCFRRAGADCVGGRARGHWDGDPEPAVAAAGLSSFDLGDEDFEMTGSVTPIGANLAFRAAVFRDGTRYAPTLGRVGACLLSGEETELIGRLRAAGKRVWYCAGAVVRHRAGGERLRVAYYLRREHWIGISYALIDAGRGRAVPLAVAAARLGKVALLDLPRWLGAAVTGDLGGRLRARMEMRRQFGYVRGALFGTGLVPRPATDRS